MLLLDKYRRRVIQQPPGRSLAAPNISRIAPAATARPVGKSGLGVCGSAGSPRASRWVHQAAAWCLVRGRAPWGQTGLCREQRGSLQRGQRTVALALFYSRTTVFHCAPRCPRCQISVLQSPVHQPSGGRLPTLFGGFSQSSGCGIIAVMALLQLWHYCSCRSVIATNQRWIIYYNQTRQTIPMRNQFPLTKGLNQGAVGPEP